MFEKNQTADRHTLRPSAAQESSDTTITVNNSGGSVPARPDFSINRYTGTRAGAPSAPAAGSTVVETHREVNWGGVAKGAAIVAGVILVGVVAFTVVPAALTSLGVIGPGGALTGVLGTAGEALTTVGGYAMQGLNFADNFIFTLGSNIISGLGLGGVASSAAAAATSVSAATVSAVHTATGAIAAGASMAFAAPLAVKTMLTTAPTTMVDTVHAVPPATGVEHQAVSQVSGIDTGVHHKDATHAMVADGSDGSAALHDHSAANMKTATKAAHFAAHNANHTADGDHRDAEAPDTGEEAPEQRSRRALTSTAKTSQAWADRVGQREKAHVTARDSEFAKQLASDRAQLDAALAERS